MAQSEAIDDPHVAGSSRGREKSVMFVRTLNCIESARVPPRSISAQ